MVPPRRRFRFRFYSRVILLSVARYMYAIVHVIASNKVGTFSYFSDVRNLLRRFVELEGKLNSKLRILIIRELW